MCDICLSILFFTCTACRVQARQGRCHSGTSSRPALLGIPGRGRVPASCRAMASWTALKKWNSGWLPQIIPPRNLLQDWQAVAGNKLSLRVTCGAQDGFWAMIILHALQLAAGRISLQLSRQIKLKFCRNSWSFSGNFPDVVGRCRIEAVKEILTDAVVRHLDKI